MYRSTCATAPEMKGSHKSVAGVAEIQPLAAYRSRSVSLSKSSSATPQLQPAKLAGVSTTSSKVPSPALWKTELP